MLETKSDELVLTLVQEWIDDLSQAGMSYSRISTRLHLSPSTIQKIMREERFPRLKTIQAIGAYYLKIFDSAKSYGDRIEQYFVKNGDRISNTMAQTRRLLQQLTLTLENEMAVRS